MQIHGYLQIDLLIYLLLRIIGSVSGKNPNIKRDTQKSSHKHKELSKPKHVDKYYKNKGNIYQANKNIIGLNDLNETLPRNSYKQKKRTNNIPIDNLRRSKRLRTSNTPL